MNLQIPELTTLPDLTPYTLALIIIIFGGLGGLIGFMYRYDTENGKTLPLFLKIIYSTITGIAVAFLAMAFISKDPQYTIPAIMFASGLVGRMVFQQLIETIVTIISNTLTRIGKA